MLHTRTQILNWLKENLVEIGAIAYMLCFCLFAQFSLPFSWILLLLGFCFYRHIEHLLCVTLLLSVIRGYYPCTMVEIFSIYTVLALVILFVWFTGKREIDFQKKPLLVLGLLAIAAIASWLPSSNLGAYGLMTVLILIFMASLIQSVQLKIGTIVSLLAKLSFVLILWYSVCLIIDPSFTRNGRLSLDASVNVDTFGASCAILSAILWLSFYFDKRAPWKIIGGIAALVLLVLSGSRGALLGFVIAIVIPLLIDTKRRYSTKRMLYILIALVAVVAFVIIVLPLIGFSRFSISGIINSVGTADRFDIWATLLAYIFTNGYWLIGYGPGTISTSYVFYKTMNRELFHAHNTFLESFGEMGVIGLGLSVTYVVFAVISAVRQSKNQVGVYILLGLAFYILAHGMIESFYQNFFFWAILALCLNNFTRGGGDTETQKSSKQTKKAV